MTLLQPLAVAPVDAGGARGVDLTVHKDKTRD